MVKFVVVSDNHGRKDILKTILENNPDADAFFHCGDSEMSAEELIGFFSVEGNNDFYTNLPLSIDTEIKGFKIHIEHGHMIPYLNRKQYMSYKAQELDCDFFFSGHTHIYDIFKENKTTFVNPGSLKYNRDATHTCYAIIEIDDHDIKIRRVDI